MSHYICTV